MTLIGVKSKYGSCSGNCTGLININNKKGSMAPPYCLKSRFGAEISSVRKRSLKSGSNPG